MADFNLPVFDEPNHPALGNYAHEHTKAWSRSVASADAFVFVMPEYNFGPPPSLLNVLNFVAATTMLDELALWAGALEGLRATRK